MPAAVDTATDPKAPNMIAGNSHLRFTLQSVTFSFTYFLW